MFIIPKAGLVITNPATMKPLPLEGANVAGTGHDSYWVRVLESGDATLGEAPQEEPESVAPSTEEEPATEVDEQEAEEV